MANGFKPKIIKIVVIFYGSHGFKRLVSIHIKDGPFSYWYIILTLTVMKE